MEQDDEEFEQLLGEIPHVTSTNSVIDVIPRATSAPPHLEEVQRVRGSSAAAVEEGASSGGGKCGGEDDDDEATPHMLQPFVDIRCDEHYESFYRSYAGVKKLPPPMDNRTLYSDFPVLSPKASSTHISPFLAELLPLDDDVPSHRSSQRKQQRLDMQRKQQQDALQQHQITSQLQAAQQQQHREPSPNFQAPAGAHQYGALSENDMSSNMSSDPHLTAAFGKLGFDEGGSNSLLQSLIDDAGDNNNRPIISNGSSAAGGGLVGRPPLSNGHGLNGSNGLYAHHMDTFGTGSTASYDLYASRSSPSLDLFQGKRLVSMNGLGNGSGSYDGMSDYAAEVSTEALKKAFRQQNSPGGYGSGGASQYQQQQQQLEVVAATMQAAARSQSAGATGNILHSGRVQKQTPFDYTVTDYFEAQAQAQATATAAQYAQLEEQQQQQQQRLYIQQQLIERQKQIQLLASLQAQVNGKPGRDTYHPSGGRIPVRGSRNSSDLQQLGFAAANAQHNEALQRKLRLHQSVNPDTVWGSNVDVSEFGLSENSRRVPTVGSVCRYFVQGYCSRGEACPFLHSPLQGMKAVSHTASVPVKEAFRATATRDGRLPPYLDKYLRRSLQESHSGKANSFAPASGVQRISDVVSNGHANGHGYPNGHFSLGSGYVPPSPTDVSDTLAHPQSRIQDHMEFDVGWQLIAPHNLQQQQPPKYTTLEEVEGHIYLIAKDQHGCRFLQKKFDEGGPEDVEKIFREIISHITELMKDPFGNYLVQKLLEVCDEKQRMEILHAVTMDGELVSISLNMHG
jgi:hypothetical protein